MSCQDSYRRLSLRMHALRTAWSQDVTRLRMAFPKENDGHRHERLFLFFFFCSKSFCCTAAIHSSRLCWSFWKEKRRSLVDPLPARVQAIITHDCGIFLEGLLTVEAKKSKIKQRTLMAYTSATSTLSIKQWNARTTKFWWTEVSSHNSRHEPP